MKNKKIALTALVITLLTISSKFIGFFRDVLMAAKYGTGIDSDAFIMGQSIVFVVSMIVITSLTVAFIPMLSDYKANKTEKENRSFINNVYTVTILLTGILGLLTFFFADIVVGFFAPGFSLEAKLLTKNVLLIMLPTIVIAAVVLLNNSFLQSKGKFYVPALIGYPSNGALIFALVFMTSSFGIIGLSVAFTIGVILQLIFQQYALKKADFKYAVELDFKNEGMRNLMILVVPTIIGSGVNMINTTVDRMVGSTLGAGSVAALNFSNKLSLFILGIVAASVTTVFYTAMSNHSASGNKEDFNQLLKGTVNTLSLLILPSSVGFIVLRDPIVSFVFARGAFDQNAVAMTSSCLMFFSVGLIGFALRDVLARSFYAIQDTVSPMINGIICVIINIILNLILSKYLGVGGLALATSISGLVGTVLLMILLHKKIGDFGIKDIITSFVKILFASILMGVAVYFSYEFLVTLSKSLIVNLFASVLVGVLVYGVCVYFLRVREFNQLLKYGYGKIMRKKAA